MTDDIITRQIQLDKQFPKAENEDYNDDCDKVEFTENTGIEINNLVEKVAYWDKDNSHWIHSYSLKNYLNPFELTFTDGDGQTVVIRAEFKRKLLAKLGRTLVSMYGDEVK